VKHLAYNLFGRLLVFAVWLTSCTTTHDDHVENVYPCDTTILHNRLVEKDNEVKSAEKTAFDYQQKYYAKCKEVKRIKAIPTSAKNAQVPVVTQTRNAFPITAEYNARTDKWPITNNPKVIAAQEQNRREWDSLWERSKDYRREYDSALFKPKI
jgi:hypothetical protein